jgi:hypothetical protein
MKTSWRFEYVRERLCGGSDRAVAEWVRAKEAEMEAATGVPWSCSPVNCKHAFHPWLDFHAVKAEATDDEIERFLAEIDDRDYTSFSAVHVGTGWPFSKVMAVANAASSLLIFNVDRMGKPCFVRRKTEKEDK